MKLQLKHIMIGGLILTQSSPFVSNAGNEDRIGAAGGQQLMINPWTRSSGFANANSASVNGIEAMFGNIAGLAFINKTEINLAHTRWMSSSGVGINSGALAQRISETSVLAFGIMTTSFGDIQRTTNLLPEGGLGNYRMQVGHFTLGFAKEFSNSIYAGAAVKVVTEGIPDARANGVAFDAGIRYITGKQENIKFGISLKNIGPKMRFQGDGLSVKNTLDEKEFTLQQRTEGYELPSILNIGFSYDYYIGEPGDDKDGKIKGMHRITGAFNFMSNSFGRDQFSLGAEYAFKEMFMLRGGFVYEDKMFNANETKNVLSGPTAGFTVALPVSATGSSVDLDYSHRMTRVMGGIHTIGLRVNL